MKRVALIILCVLLALSLTSCEKDKADEMVTTLQNFISEQSTCSIAESVVESGVAMSYKENKEINFTFTQNTYLNSENLKDFIKAVENYDSDDITITECSFISGNASGYVSIEDTISEDLTYSDVKFKAKYTYKGEDKDKEYTLSGNYWFDENDNSNFRSRDYVINGIPHNVKYAISKKTYKYIEASVNKKDVNLRLLNAVSKDNS